MEAGLTRARGNSSAVASAGKALRDTSSAALTPSETAKLCCHVVVPHKDDGFSLTTVEVVVSKSRRSTGLRKPSAPLSYETPAPDELPVQREEEVDKLSFAAHDALKAYRR